MSLATGHADVTSLRAALDYRTKVGLPICILAEWGIDSLPRVAETETDFVRWVHGGLIASVTGCVRLIPVERADDTYRKPEGA